MHVFDNSACGSKEKIYVGLLPQIAAVIGGETDLIANLANVAAMLFHSFDWLWAGFYIVKGDELVLGPFQGPLACTRIAKGKGVCGKSWEAGHSLLVPDVHVFPGHIACSSESNSEIVVPILYQDAVVAVLDIDSKHFAHFDGTDQRYLSELSVMLSKQRWTRHAE